MKAPEVLNRYANGERDFRRADLRGQSFKGQDLSGADFSEADIRGANFFRAVLRKTNFTLAKTGVQNRCLIGQFIAATWLSVVVDITSFAVNRAFSEYIITSSKVQPYTVIPGILSLLINAVIIFIIATQGFTVKVSRTITLIGLLAGLSTIVIGSAAVKCVILSTLLAVFIFPMVVSKDFVLTFVFTGALAAVFASAGTVALDSLFAYVIAACARATTPIGATIKDVFELTGVESLIILGAIPIAALSLYIVWCVFQENGEFTLVRRSILLFTTTGGTDFCDADLTDANFTEASLINTKFADSEQGSTRLHYVCWDNAKDLELAIVGNSVLADPKVRDLLTSHDGYKKSYVNTNLRGANLNRVNLNEANLKWADLSEATLRYADLRGADMTEALALGADFTMASLTGACLEAWNIDSNTNLESVHCQYVYLLRDQQERRPSSGDFAPGEFTKLFQEALNTVDLIFRNGVDWKAFVAAFQTVQVNNDGTELTIQSIENKGDGVVVVRVSVPETADKAKIHGEFNQNYDLALKALEAKYHAELKAKDEQITIYREKSADMTEILRLLANRPVTVEVNASAESKAMNDSTDKSQTNKSQSVNIGGNVTGSTLNFGDISGSVSNVVNQLPSSSDPAQPGIKELLIELQAAIETDADLPEKGKASALEHVKMLAEVAQDPEQPEKKGLGSQAVTFLKGAVSFLPDTAKLAEACSKLLPLITKALGLPF